MTISRIWSLAPAGLLLVSRLAWLARQEIPTGAPPAEPGTDRTPSIGEQRVDGFFTASERRKGRRAERARGGPGRAGAAPRSRAQPTKARRDRMRARGRAS